MAITPIKPLTFSSGGKRTSTRPDVNAGWGSSYTFSSKGGSQPTAIQQLQKIHAELEAEKRKKGFFSQVGSGLMSGLEFIARPSHAVAEGTRAALHGEDNSFDFGEFLHGMREGITGRSKTGFGQVLSEHSGFVRQHKVLGGALGLGLDIATDPTNLIFVAAAPVTAGGSLGVLAAKIGVQRAALSTAIKVAENAGKHSADQLDEAIGVLGKAATHPEAPELRTTFELAKRERLAKEATEPLDDKQMADLAGLSEASMVDTKPLWDNRIAIKAQIPFLRRDVGNSIHRGALTLRTGMKPPSLAKTASSKGVLGKLPGAPRAAAAVGKAFKPGWGREKFHALERVAKRVAERLDAKYVEGIGKHMAPFVKGGADELDEASQLDALHFGETTPGLVVGKERILNERMLQAAVGHGAITEQQARFISAWHNVTEELRLADRNFNVPYKDDLDEVLYVPHAYTKDGRKFDAGHADRLTTPGFSHTRLSREKSAKMLKEMHDQGIYKDLVETNPIKLLSMRSRRGAKAHADRMMVDLVAATEGIPTHIADMSRIAKLADQQGKRFADLDKLETQKNSTWQKLLQGAKATAQKRHQGRVDKLMAKHNKRTKELEKSIRSLRAKLGIAKKKLRIPSGARLMGMTQKQFEDTFRGDHPGLKSARVVAKRLRSRNQAALRAEAAMKRLKPKEGEKAHGSNHKGILAKLFADTKPTTKERRAVQVRWERQKKALLTAPFKRGETWQKRLETYIADVKKDVKDDWDTKYAEVISPVPRLMPAQLAQKVKALERHRASLEPKIRQLEAERDAHEGRLVGALEDKFVKEEKRAAVHNREIDRIERAYDLAIKSKPNPNLPSHFVPVERLKTETGVPYALPPEVALGLTRIQTAIQEDEFMEEWGKMWQKATGMWKLGVTVVNPGYRMRNTMSDLWNMYVSGVPIWAMTHYNAKAAHLMVRAKRGDVEANRLIMEAYDHGILSGLFQGEIEKVIKQIGGRDKAWALLKQGNVPMSYARMMTTFNRHAENLTRMSHYMYRRDYEKLGPAKAALEVKAAHFDYEDLTPMERKLKAYVIPFYTWTRKNVPYQLTQMVSRPGRYSAFDKIRTESEFAAGDEEDGSLMPEFLEKGLGFRVPGGGVLMPQFGPSDLARVSQPRSMLGMIGPGLKVPLELGMNQSTLTGAPIYGDELSHPLNPVSETGSKLFSALGINTGTTARRVHGEQMQGPGANPLATYAAGQVPFLNYLVNQRSNIRTAQRGNSRSTISYLGGLSTFDPDQEALAAVLAQQNRESFAQYLRGLRDAGYWPEAERKKSKFQKAHEAQLVAQAGG